MDKYPLMRFVGRYFRGIPRGFCWKGLWGGGYICGYVDSKDGSFSGTCLLNVLWGQWIKLIQVVFSLELLENQWNDLLFIEIVPSHCFGASEVQTKNRS